MFSSIFGKRRSSPVEDNSTPPIPGPKPDDGFVVVNPSYPGGGGGLYPNVGGLGTSGYPLRPAPPTPVARNICAEQTFHYLQGVPFTLSKELQMARNKDTIGVEIGDLLAYATKRMNMNSFNYDFSVERSVLKECQ